MALKRSEASRLRLMPSRFGATNFFVFGRDGGPG
jgi:hypothetical protein